MPLLDLVCMGCWEVVFGATELEFEDAVGKEMLVVSGGRVGSGVMVVLSVLGTKTSVGDIGGWDGNNGWVGLLDKGNERSLSKYAETEA